MQRSSGNIDNNTYGSWTEVDESAGSKNRLRRPYSIYGAGCLLVMRDPETNSRDKPRDNPRDNRRDKSRDRPRDGACGDLCLMFACVRACVLACTRQRDSC